MQDITVPSIKDKLDIVHEMRADGIELKPNGRDFLGCCPFHNENTPSFRVHPSTQRFKCFGCGKTGDVIEYIQLLKKCSQAEAIQEAKRRAGIAEKPRPSPIKPPRSDKPTVYATVEKLREAAQYHSGGASVVEWNEYTNPDTKAIELITIRLEKLGEKSFRQASPCDGGWCLKNLLDVNPIFNRTMVREHQAVVIVEGEKCARALRKLGVCATTSPGGANAGSKADWSPLAGKHVTFWRDFDIPGQKYQDDVIECLNALVPPPMINVVDVLALGLSDHGDVIDFLATHTPEAAIEVIANASVVGTVAEMERDIEDAISGVRYNVPFPWPELSKGMRALIPGAVSILCGPPGDGKSLVLLQVLAHCLELKVPAKLLCCEDGAPYHARRRLAQVSAESHLTDDEWCKDFPDKARAFKAEHRVYMGEFVKMLDAPAKKCKLTVDDMLAWVKHWAEAGMRVLAIDPITAMMKGQQGFEDDRKFMMEAKSIIEQYKSSLLLVTHPPKVASGKFAAMQGMTDLAGGAAYERFSQSIWGFFAHEEKTKPLDGNGNPNRGKAVTFTRTIKVMKARNSWGKGKNFAFNFDLPRLSIEEVGQVER